MGRAVADDSKPLSLHPPLGTGGGCSADRDRAAYVGQRLPARVSDHAAYTFALAFPDAWACFGDNSGADASGRIIRAFTRMQVIAFDSGVPGSPCRPGAWAAPPTFWAKEGSSALPGRPGGRLRTGGAAFDGVVRADARLVVWGPANVRTQPSDSASVRGASGSSRSSDSRYFTQPLRNCGQAGIAGSGSVFSGSSPHSYFTTLTQPSAAVAMTTSRQNHQNGHRLSSRGFR
jgi:hypothetical protein